MHIKSLNIRDFGIFNNVSLDDISQEIVVIGGNNRAGKSTLLDILRYFPYGFSKAMDIPQARIEYQVEGKFIDDNNEELIARVNGYSKPHIFHGSGRESIENLYNDVDLFTYKEIFTISLDELKYTGKEDEKLQSILLGAGLKDVICVPGMISDFKRQSERIGGKNGNPKIKLFKESYNEISEGINLKEKVLTQVEKYNSDINRIDSLKNNIHELQISIKSLEDNLFIFEILKVNYDMYKEADRLKLILNNEKNKAIYEYIEVNNLSLDICTGLSDEYSIVLNKYEEVEFDFLKNPGISESILECFKEYGKKIQNAELRISGIIQKIKNYKILLDQCKSEKHELVVDATDINEDWKDDLTKILDINTEAISFIELSENIDELRQVEGKIEDVNYDIKQWEEKLLELKINNQSNEKNMFIKNIIFLCSFLIMGFVVYNFNKVFGVLISIAGIVVASTNIVLARQTKVNSNTNISVKTINLDITKKKNQLTDLLDKKHSLEKSFRHYRDLLNLKIDVPIASIKIYFTLVRDLKKKVLHLKYDVDNMSVLEKNINLELGELLNLLIKFNELLVIDELNVRRNLIENSEYLFENIKKLVILLNVYEKFSDARISKEFVEEKIRKTLRMQNDMDILLSLNKNIEWCKIFNEYGENQNKYGNLKQQLIHSLKIDRVQKTLTKDKNDIGLFKKFQTIVNNYIDMEHIKRAEGELKSKYEAEIKALSGLKEEMISLNDEVNRLYNSDDITIAHNKIENGRRRLKKVAEEYAINNAAAFILKQLQNDFIQGAKNTILNGTGKILSDITNGQFQEVLPVDNLSKTDFKTLDKNGILNESMESLSRGTKEQLFLAVRLSRIGEIKSKLPIIIDDSLVNFDVKHLNNSIKLFSELSKTNQIFFLTCHPEVVTTIDKINKKAQFFKVDEGKFFSVSGSELVDYLKGGII